MGPLITACPMLAEGLAGPRAWDSEIRDSGDGELWGPRGKTRPPKSTGIQKFSTRSPANTTGLWVRVRSATRATRVCPLVCSRHANTPGVSRRPLPPSSLLLSRGHSAAPALSPSPARRGARAPASFLTSVVRDPRLEPGASPPNVRQPRGAPLAGYLPQSVSPAASVTS